MQVSSNFVLPYLRSKSKFLNLFLLVAIVASSSYIFCPPVLATIEDAQLKEAEAKAKQAEAAAREAEIKANKAEAELLFPTLPTPLEGKVEAENLNIEPTFLAYQAMSSVANSIFTNEISPLVTRPGVSGKVAIYVYDKDKLNALLSDQSIESSFSKRLDFICTLYNEKNIFASDGQRECTRKPQESSGSQQDGGATAAAAIGFALNILQLFKQDLSFKGANVSITPRAFAAQLASIANDKAKGKISVYYPPEHPVLDTKVMENLALEIANLVDIREVGRKRILEFPSEVKGPQKEEKEAIKQINGLADSLMEELQKTSGDYLKSIVRARVSQKFTEDEKDIVLLSVNVIAGGTNRTKRNIFTSSLRHSGGAIVEYIGYNKNGSIRFSGTPSCYTGFMKVDNSNTAAKTCSSNNVQQSQ